MLVVICDFTEQVANGDDSSHCSELDNFSISSLSVRARASAHFARTTSGQSWGLAAPHSFPTNRECAPHIRCWRPIGLKALSSLV